MVDIAPKALYESRTRSEVPAILAPPRNMWKGKVWNNNGWVEKDYRDAPCCLAFLGRFPSAWRKWRSRG